MDERYIPAHEAWRKMNLASNMNASVYVYGATGFGKTRLVREFLQGQEVRWLSPYDEEWDLSCLPDGSRGEGPPYIVVDDLQWIQDEERINLLVDAVQRSDIRMILIGRMKSPIWMMPLIAEGKLIVISEENLVLNLSEVNEIAESMGFVLDQKDAEYLTAVSQGNAYIVATYLNMLRSGNRIGNDLTELMMQIFADHLENNVIPQWTVPLQEFLMQVSVVDEFTLPMAVMITGDDQASAMLAQALKVGNFMRKEDELFILRPVLVKALRSRALKVMGLKKFRRCMSNAGLYYETQDDVVNALKMYEASQNSENISTLLIRNGRRHPGIGHFYELRRYYLALEDEEIAASPVLMCAMSMLYSVLMNAEQSEYWYGKLKEYEIGVIAGHKMEASELLLYLDLTLPHRSLKSHQMHFEKYYNRIINYNLPRPSLTNNTPSLINGDKDLCEWTREEGFADDTGKKIESALGVFGRGFRNCFLCEKVYEKAVSDTDASHHAMLVQMETEGGGNLELMFAALGVQVRLSLLNGRTENALVLVKTFEDRIAPEKNASMMTNLKALQCRVELVLGNSGYSEEWMAEAPDELSDFCTLEHYSYMTKVLCYLDQGKNFAAMDLLERLSYFARADHRHYILMESGLFKAIAFRREKREWQKILKESLAEIFSFGFVRIISEKGAGILPLLKEIKREYLESYPGHEEWFNTVMKETAAMADRYPGYLNCDSAQLADFGESAMMVLRMQADGLSIREIAVQLDLSERTVKYHAAENYKKLGAKGKTDAVKIARSLNLI